jgi:hypothetical protein
VTFENAIVVLRHAIDRYLESQLNDYGALDNYSCSGDFIDCSDYRDTQTKVKGDSMKKAFPAMLVAMLLIAGCTPVERTAYNTVVAAKAFLDKEKLSHPECTNTPSSIICVDLQKAVAAKDVLIDAITVYCSGPDFNAGGACNAPQKGTAAYDQAVAKLNGAIANWNQVSADLKAVTGGK